MPTAYADFARALFASRESPARLVRSGWLLFGTTPAGRRAFSAMIGRFIPYTGSIGPRIERLEDGVAEIRIHDTPALRNHLASLHAAALFNLIEVTANLAVTSRMPDDARFIVASMSVEYVKKARGDVVAKCVVGPIESNARREVDVDVTITDGSGEVVTRGRVKTLVGPVRG